jgi:predicted adenine nucleotide alpha hydrolase (AANH) superfamily ATPase
MSKIASPGSPAAGSAYSAEQCQRAQDDTAEYIGEGQSGLQMGKPSILLHSCCAPCSTAVCERLTATYDVTLFFYNPNIDDEAEYLKRLRAVEKFVKQHNASVPAAESISLIKGDYNPAVFHRLAQGLEDEAEGGKRCRLCI